MRSKIEIGNAKLTSFSMVMGSIIKPPWFVDRYFDQYTSIIIMHANAIHVHMHWSSCGCRIRQA